jgi:hypothetical protein
MISALILVFSLAALGQFGFYCWRAAVITFAATEVADNTLENKDFQALDVLNEICPPLNASTPGIAFVRSYYRAVEWLSVALRASCPSAAAWAEREMATCARYMAVVVDQRLQSNQVCFAVLRSF